MGFFSSKKRVTVASTTIKLVQDTPDTLSNAVLSAIITGREIVPDIIASSLGGLSMKAKSMYNYARDHYTYGLPNGSVEVPLVPNTVIALVIQDIIGVPVTLNYSVLDICDPTYFAYQHMADNLGWDYQTNICSTHPDGATVEFDSAIFLANDNIEITFTGTTNKTIFTVAGLDTSATYYHVGYFILSQGTSVLNHFFYKADSNTYPQLNIRIRSTTSPYYPIVPIRQDNEDMTDISKENTDLYKTSLKTLKYLGLDFLQIGAGIQANPDVDDIDHAYVIMGVHLQSDEPTSIEYLHEYFKHLGVVEYSNKDRFDHWIANESLGTPPRTTIRIHEANYDSRIGFNYVNVTRVTGSIGAIGTVSRTNVIRDTVKVTLFSGQRYEYEDSQTIFRKQISATVYEQVLVHGPYHVSYIYKSHTVETSLAESLEADEDDFIIPLHKGVAESLGLSKHNRLMFDAMRLVVNSYEVTKVRWYQTSLFSSLIQVLALAITVYSGGSLAGITASIASIGVVVQSIMLNIIKSQIYQIAADFIVDKVGVEFSFLVSLLSTVTGLASNSTSIFSSAVKGAPFAIDALGTANAILSSINKSVLGDFQSIQDELAEFTEESTLAQKELDELSDELNNDFGVDPLDLVEARPIIDSYETPSNYYYRTIHVGNVGVRMLDSISLYVDTALQLPTDKTII